MVAGVLGKIVATKGGSMLAGNVSGGRTFNALRLGKQ